MMRADALVLDASLRMALVTVRSLGRRGLAVAAAETHPEAPAFVSRWCQGGFVFPAQEGTDGYDALLEQWLDRTGARVLFASHDATIALLRRHRARLERSEEHTSELQSPCNLVCRLLLEKKNMTECSVLHTGGSLTQSSSRCNPKCSTSWRVDCIQSQRS